MWSRRALFVLPLAPALPLFADDPTTKLTIEVTDLKDKPVERAAVVVKFVEGRSIKKLGRKVSRHWELKTNQEGVATIPPIPQGKILIQVIARNYQTFGDVVEVYENERTIHVQLKPPQPQYSAHED
jgi:hypothetical protein